MVSSGADALRHLRTEHFDAVLMDCQMPDMDGLEVTRHLRSGICGEINRAVPIIALTANAFAEDRNACMAAGMSDFLTKPVLAQTLLQCVQRWCRGSDTSGEVAQLSEVAARPVTDRDARLRTCSARCTAHAGRGARRAGAAADILLERSQRAAVDGGGGSGG